MNNIERFPEDTTVKYIKLGDSNKYAKECIENGYARLGFDPIPHELCEEGRWDEIEDTYTRNCLKYFYEEGSATIWVTFHNGCLYWTRLEEDGNWKLEDENSYFKVRDCVNGWSNESVDGNTLYEYKLSGRVTKTKGYQGTICDMDDLTLQYINNDLPKPIQELRAQKEKILDSLDKAVKNLDEDDFELLVDIIFRESGFKRISQLGGVQQKDTDLIVRSPILDKEFSVQIKTGADFSDLQKFAKACEDRLESEHYFFVSKPDEKLRGEDSKIVEIGDEDEVEIEIVSGKRLANWVFELGLTEWVEEKAWKL